MKTRFAMPVTLSLMAMLGLPLVAQAAEQPAASEDRLVIVDAPSGHIIYDDGRDDLFCVSRVRHWRDEDGYRHRYRSMRCR